MVTSEEFYAFLAGDTGTLQHQPSMVHPKPVVKISSTSKSIVVAVKVLFVLLILFLLPKLVQAKRRKRQARRGFIEARQLRKTCESEVCGSYIPEESLNCLSLCLSPACYEQVYNDSPLEDGEIDFDRVKLFDECFMEESKTVRQRRRDEKKQS